MTLAMVILAGAVLVATRDDGDDQAVRTEEGPSSSTTMRLSTTTTETPSTTASTEPATTTTTAPSTTAAPPPPPPPPPPAAPPAPSGSLDVGAVLAFAKAGSGGTAPYTYTGANQCPAGIQRPSDAGDDTARDITTWYLARYCDGVYRGVLATDLDTPALEAAWIQIDSTGGGCGGIDHVVIGWHDDSGGGGAAVVATPGCDRGSWRWVEPAGFPVFNGAWLQLDFRGSAVGNPSSFDWRGFVQAVGETGAAIDRVPNDGPEHFVV